MEKILIYTNDFEDVKRLMQYHRKFAIGREIAWATSDTNLVQLMAVGKLLVVNHETYYYDFVVSDEKFDAELVVPIDMFLEELE